MCGQLGVDAEGEKGVIKSRKAKHSMTLPGAPPTVMCVWSVRFGALCLPRLINGSHFHSLHYQSPLSLSLQAVLGLGMVPSQGLQHPDGLGWIA